MCIPTILLTAILKKATKTNQPTLKTGFRLGKGCFHLGRGKLSFPGQTSLLWYKSKNAFDFFQVLGKGTTSLPFCRWDSRCWVFFCTQTFYHCFVFSLITTANYKAQQHPSLLQIFIYRGLQLTTVSQIKVTHHWLLHPAPWPVTINPSITSTPATTEQFVKCKGINKSDLKTSSLLFQVNYKGIIFFQPSNIVQMNQLFRFSSLSVLQRSLTEPILTRAPIYMLPCCRRRRQPFRCLRKIPSKMDIVAI